MAPPRKNGELVFEAPWESRAFGMALALHDRGAYDWPAFSEKLAEHVAEISDGGSGEWVLPVAPDTESRYYTAWLAALEEMLVERDIVSSDEVEAMTARVASGAFDHA